MTFFNKLFRRNPKPSNTLLASNQIASKVESDSMDMIDLLTQNKPTMTTQNTPAQDLFVDNNPPVTKPQKIGRIVTFLSYNYFRLGLSDGYESHTQDSLQLGKRKIKADFRLSVDQAIEEKRAEKVKLHHSLNGLSSLPEMCQGLETRMQEVEGRIAELQLQMQLSTEDEGWVMTAIYPYHKGYLQGIKDWLESENLLGISSNF